MAQTALSSYPDLFVANLASINKCVAPETLDAVFDRPGRAVAYGSNISASSKSSFSRGECTGKGRTIALTSALPASSPSFGGSGSSGNNGQWQGGNANQQQQSSASNSTGDDGQWHPDMYGESTDSQQTSSQHQHTSSQSQQAPSQPQQASAADPQPVDAQSGQAPSPEVEKELNAYLASL